MLVADEALEGLVRQLREDDSVISPLIRDPAEDIPVLGLLAAAGPRAAAAPGDYALLIESIREGYLLHYGRPRVVAGADGDLALLAGDYLYARGLERLAALQDLLAVRELTDLISLAAQLHSGADGLRNGDTASALWLASVTAVTAGPDPAHERGKRDLRAGSPQASRALWR